MRAPITRPPQRAARVDDRATRTPTNGIRAQPVARLRVRPRATSSPPLAARPPRDRASLDRFGPFAIYEALGEGGMASVHRAQRVDGAGIRAPIALKRLHTSLSEDRDFVEAFAQEARLARLIQHRNIAQAYELGKQDGIYYIAMELVRGPTLQAVLTRARTAGAIPLPIVVEILIQLCDALDHAHNLCDEIGRPLGLIHRDVSPANVILSDVGVVKLIDFGIAKAARSRVQTQAGCIKGKLSYVAPEYTKGQLDARVDLFAVGVIAHELLTGRRLFDAETDIGTIYQVRELAIELPSQQRPQVTLELDDIVMTALERDPSRRWQNAAAMRTALQGVAADLGGRVGSSAIRDWVAWAFAPGADDADLDAPTIDRPTQPVARKPVAARPPPVPAPRPEVRSSGLFDDLTVPSPRIELVLPDEDDSMLSRPTVRIAPRSDVTIPDPTPLTAERARSRERRRASTEMVAARRRFGEAIARRADRRRSPLPYLVVLLLAALLVGFVWGDDLAAVLAAI